MLFYLQGDADFSFNIWFIGVRYKSDRSRKIQLEFILECFAEKDRSHAARVPVQLKYFWDQKFIISLILPEYMPSVPRGSESFEQFIAPFRSPRAEQLSSCVALSILTVRFIFRNGSFDRIMTSWSVKFAHRNLKVGMIERRGYVRTVLRCLSLLTAP